MKKQSFYLSGIIILLLFYFLLSLMVNNHLILPNIDSIFNSLFSILKDGKSYHSIFMTLFRTLVSFIFALISGVIIAIVNETFPKSKYIIHPLISLLKSIPAVIIVIIFILVLGFNKTPYFIVFILTLPLIYESTNLGFESVNKELIDAMMMDESSNHLKLLVSIKLPLAANYILLGLINAFGLALKSEIMAEILIGSSSVKGIGSSIDWARNYFDMPSLLAWTIILLIIVLTVDLLLKQLGSYFQKILY